MLLGLFEVEVQMFTEGGLITGVVEPLEVGVFQGPIDINSLSRVELQAFVDQVQSQRIFVLDVHSRHPFGGVWHILDELEGVLTRNEAEVLGAGLAQHVDHQFDQV